MNEDKLNEYENYIEGIRIELNNIAILNITTFGFP